MLSLLSLPNSSPRPRSNSHNSTRHGQLHFARPASSCRPPVAQGRPFTLPYLQRPQLSTSAGLPTPTPPAAVPRLPAVVVVGVGCAMYDPLQFRWRSPSLSRASVSRSARHISLSLRIRVAFSSVPLSRVGSCFGREISLTRRRLEKADDGWGWPYRQPPSLGVARLSHNNVSFLGWQAPEFPPKPLDSSPRWVAPILVLRGSECCPWGQIVKMGGCRHRRHGRGGTARQKALVLLCSRLAAANTSASRSVVLSSIFETQVHVFRSRIPHPQRALPHYGTPSTGTLCSVAWPTVDLPRSVLGSSAHSWCRARSLRGGPFALHPCLP